MRWTAVKRLNRNIQMTDIARELMIENWEEPCCICGSDFSPDDALEVKVADHCNLTGQVIGVAHSKCNVKVTAGSFVLVFSTTFPVTTRIT